MQRVYPTTLSPAVSILWSIEKNCDAGPWSHKAQILVEALKTDSGCLENKMRKCVRTELYSEVII